MSDYMRRLSAVRKDEKCKILPINCSDCSEHPNTCGNIKKKINSNSDKEEWENEFDREEMYETPFP